MPISSIIHTCSATALLDSWNWIRGGGFCTSRFLELALRDSSGGLCTSRFLELAIKGF